MQTRTAGQHWQSGSMLVEQGVGCSLAVGTVASAGIVLYCDGLSDVLIESMLTRIF